MICRKYKMNCKNRVRKTRQNDVGAVMEIIGITRNYFREEGIPQWQGEYPSRERILEDIKKGESYVYESAGKVCAFCAIVSGVERDYINIYDGKWKNDREYVALHRVAVHPDAKGKGVAAALVGEAVKVARAMGILDIRCDTHEYNRNMRRMLEKNGFEYCGVIYLSADGEPRVAYHRTLDGETVSAGELNG